MRAAPPPAPFLALLLLFGACALPAGRESSTREAQTPTRSRAWNAGEFMQQGTLGVVFLDEHATSGGPRSPARGTVDRFHYLPMITGGGQWKLLGDGIDIGVEGLFGAGARASASAAFLPIDVDLLLADLAVGPFVGCPLSDQFRAFAAVGPVFQFAYDNQTTGAIQARGSGFGAGVYARAALEYRLSDSTWIGLGARWSGSTIDLGGLGDLSLRGTQFLVTFSKLY